MEIPFKYCALFYLNQWLEFDKVIISKLLSNDRETILRGLTEAASFYRISRNFQLKYDIEKGLNRFEPILNILKNIHKNEFEQNTVRNIIITEKKISELYGGNSKLSATTKLLWLMLKDPIIIYDSQVRKALGVRENDLYAYYSEWEQEFQKNKNEILKACMKLDELKYYTCNPENVNKLEISQDWFCKRVFDIYLWKKGNIL